MSSEHELQIHIGTKADTSGLAKAEAGLKSVGAAVKGVAALAGAGSFAALATQAINYADALDEASQRTGIATDELQKLEFAARRNGTTISALEMGLKELAQGAVANSKEFEALGIATRNLDGSQRNVRELLDDVANRLAGTESQTERTAIALKLLGRSGAELVPLLQGGAAAIKELGDEAARSGQVINSEAIAELNKAKDSIEDFKRVLTVLAGTSLGYFLKLSENAGIAAGALIYGTDAAREALDAIEQLDNKTRIAIEGKIADAAATRDQTQAVIDQAKAVKTQAGSLPSLKEDVARLEFEALSPRDKVKALRARLAEVNNRRVRVSNPGVAGTAEGDQEMADALMAGELKKRKDQLEIQAQLNRYEEQVASEDKAAARTATGSSSGEFGDGMPAPWPTRTGGGTSENFGLPKSLGFYPDPSKGGGSGGGRGIGGSPAVISLLERILHALQEIARASRGNNSSAAEFSAEVTKRIKNHTAQLKNAR